ncbi:MAG: RecX family transcriptional regulator [Geminicoccaceae bacterium]
MPRQLKKPSPERLRQRAMAYLERFSTSRANLRLVLLRRVRPEAEAFGIDAATIEGWIDALVADLARLGLVDDRMFAEGRARSLVERGKPLRHIRATLRGKGVESALVDQIVDRLDDDSDGTSANWMAAINFARRRRIGPFRDGPADAETCRHELGKLARAGFDYATARRIVEMRGDDEKD